MGIAIRWARSMIEPFNKHIRNKGTKECKSVVFVINFLYTYNNMSLRLLCFILIFLQACTLDYQDRGLYYGEQDNCCLESQDLINLRINLDGKETVTHTAWGGTVCSEGKIHFWEIVFPADQFIDYEEDFRLFFSQETKVVKTLGKIHLIYQRSRVVNATYYGVPVHCEIIGDGSLQHFGIDLPDSSPCTHYVKCDSNTAKQ